MEFNFLKHKLIIFLLIFVNAHSINAEFLKLFPNNSYYYEEKYFRILSNNYETIDQGQFWSEEEEGYGFKANKDFGSIIILKDWSMYNFKLTKVIFRKNCSFEYDRGKCDAEMWLIHTKDNGYYSPGRRIFIKQNYFIIVVPFVKANNLNPAIDMIFKFIKLKEYSKNSTCNITTEKPIKLYQIIQNQPSYLFDGQYNRKDTLFMVFTQYHFISDNDFNDLSDLYKNKSISNSQDIFKYDEKIYSGKIFRNVKNIKDIKQKVTLMAYSNSQFLKNLFLLVILFLF